MINRRTFLQSAAIVGVSAAHKSVPAKSKARMPIAFSTLGCPKWDWLKILDTASAEGFAAIELRGLQGTMNLPERPEFTPERIGQSKRELASRNLRVVCLGSSAKMHEMDKVKREAHMDEGRRFIDLAQKLGAPYVRVFGDKYVEGVPRPEMIDHIADGLRQLGSYAQGKAVIVLIESHGDFTDSQALKELLGKTNSPAVALLWDAHHTFASGKEEPEYTIKQLAPFIQHTHLKDSRPTEKGRHYVLTGEGDVPVQRQMRLLAQSGYRGYYSFEWEKAWHPEIAEPEVAIPHYATMARQYLTGLKLPTPK